jgi:hypothetical protein
MTASRSVRIDCDHPGCTRTYTGPERVWAVRREAKGNGWDYSMSRDYCPAHASSRLEVPR